MRPAIPFTLTAFLAGCSTFQAQKQDPPQASQSSSSCCSSLAAARPVTDAGFLFTANALFFVRAVSHSIGL